MKPLTEAEARILDRMLSARSAKPPKPLSQSAIRRAMRPKELDITAIHRFELEKLGWIFLRLDSEHSKRRHVPEVLRMEKGTADQLIIRIYTWGPGIPRTVAWFLELKRPGEKPSADQVDWHAKMQRLGYLTLISDSLGKTKAWMRENGMLL